MIADQNKLDNPVWHSLSEVHQNFAITHTNIKLYHPDYCPFGGYEVNKNISDFIDEYSKLTDNFFIVGDKPTFSNSLSLKNELVCRQMILEHKIETGVKNEIVKLGEEHANELFRLVNFVQPGYFRGKTFFLGDYYGIFSNSELVAVTGERMKMNGYTEISAVVTHPEHAGNGYAKQLVAFTVNKVLGQKKTPYLHVAETNTLAIKLYEKLGFKTRRKISFWNLTSN
jgi:GNAT superfamily N-acetyltransferase